MDFAVQLQHLDPLSVLFMLERTKSKLNKTTVIILSDFVNK